MEPPRVLRDADRWVGWTEARRGANSTKLPVCPSTGRIADVTDPRTWGSYRDAMGCAGGRVGFVLTEDDDVSCIDLDDVLTEDGEALPGVLKLIAGTSGVFAVEISPVRSGPPCVAPRRAGAGGQTHRGQVPGGAVQSQRVCHLDGPGALVVDRECLTAVYGARTRAKAPGGSREPDREGVVGGRGT